MALGHTTCTRAADNLIFVRESLRAIARKHGLLATFMPKYVLICLGLKDALIALTSTNIKQHERFTVCPVVWFVVICFLSVSYLFVQVFIARHWFRFPCASQSVAGWKECFHGNLSAWNVQSWWGIHGWCIASSSRDFGVYSTSSKQVIALISTRVLSTLSF